MSQSRKLWPTPGGVHPAENKLQSTQIGIASIPIPEQLIIPLSQHVGTSASAIVEVGQQVLKGQMIAEPKGKISAAIHAPSSGLVTAIEDRPLAHPSGMSGPCIVINTDQRDEWIHCEGTEHYQDIDKAELLEHIRQAGITGLGGAGFPSHVKLISSDARPIETLIINGTECEPYITADDCLMRERADQIIQGIAIVQYLLNPKETLIAIEDNKPEAIEAIRQASQDSNIEVVSFSGKYPSGGEKQLIQMLTGREVPSGGLPADIGVICQNVATVAAINEAIRFGKPLISRITTITGEACRQPQNIDTLIGTPIAELLEYCGFDDKQCQQLIMGGPMMGFAIADSNVPIIKSSNCIIAGSEAEFPAPPPAQACIRCGLCAEACPASLLPQQLFWYAKSKEYDRLEEYNLADCIECGACAYVCPSNIPLVQYYRASKAELKQRKAEQQKAEHAKLRFESRQQRLAKEEAEKAAKRAARQAAAKAKLANNEQEDPVQAAIARAKAKKAKQLAQQTSPSPESEA